MDGIIYLEDGTVLSGKGFGSIGTSMGELVFNTSVTGYQEILTDPSYAGQIITLTYPLIGNYGVNDMENESRYIYAKGLIIKNLARTPSNYLGKNTLDSMLKNMGTVGVSDVDTRSITRKIRSSGTMKCVITNENITKAQAYGIMQNQELQNKFIDEVGTKEILHIKGKGKRIALIDFGVKQNIIENLKLRDCDITVFPGVSSFEEIMNMNPQGVLLSNGPGDPKELKDAVKMVKKVIMHKPTFGICLGHQILALALGGNTYKMKYGHRGGNHGVKDLERDKAYITSQNHGYAVDMDSLKRSSMVATHINLNDNTVEGIKHDSLPVFSVQFHPEGAPGPSDTAYLFDKFLNMVV
jgi:carbamoyl-phosphate synthase small subunit